MAKFNILVIPSDNIGGVGFYRSTQPHIQLEKQFPDDFSVTFEMQPNFENLADFDKYQLIHIHKGLFIDSNHEFRPDFLAFMNYCKTKNIVTVMDIDDSWELHMHHPQYAAQKAYGLDKKVIENLKRFDYVTTTTPIFADEIQKYNKNVFVIPNAIDPTDERFKINKKTSDRIRVGMVMGSTHEYDMELLNTVSNGLSKEVLDKIQFVLCGFDLRGTLREINKQTGESTIRDLKPMETVWYRYEKMLTNNFSIVSPEYKQFLHLFIPGAQYPNVDKECYKRNWTKDINHYYEHYNDIDILLAPIEVTPFNKVKSQLKVIECAFANAAIIASDYGPYTIDLKNAIEKGGIINPEGNAILIDESKNHKDWRKYVEKLVKNPELLEQLRTNLRKDVCEKYDLRNVTAARAEFYKSIIKK